MARGILWIALMVCYFQLSYAFFLKEWNYSK